MTVGIRIKFAGLSQDEFDEVNRQIDPKGHPPDGLVFHASGPIEDGWGVIDFWESRAQFDIFEVRIREAVLAAGVQMERPPEIKEFAVHETFRG
jgi:hypothetical protein